MVLPPQLVRRLRLGHEFKVWHKAQVGDGSGSDDRGVAVALAKPDGTELDLDVARRGNGRVGRHEGTVRSCDTGSE